MARTFNSDGYVKTVILGLRIPETMCQRIQILHHARMAGDSSYVSQAAIIRSLLERALDLEDADEF